MYHVSAQGVDEWMINVHFVIVMMMMIMMMMMMIPLWLSFLFKKVVICGHYLVTLSLTINETIK